MEDSCLSLPGAMEDMSMEAILPPRPFDLGLLLLFLGLIDPPAAVGRWERERAAAATLSMIVIFYFGDGGTCFVNC